MSNDPKLLKLFDAESAINVHKQVMRESIVQGMNLEETLSQPKMKEIVEILKPGFDDHYYQSVYKEEFIYLWAFQVKYNIDYFIDRISKMPDDIDKKSTYVLLGEDPKTYTSEEIKAIESLVNKKHMSIYYILDGSAYTKQYGSTPKDRLLNCLKTLRQEWINKKEVTEPWDESSHKRWGMC